MLNTRYPHSKLKRYVEYFIIFVGVAASLMQLSTFFVAVASQPEHTHESSTFELEQALVSFLCVGIIVIFYVAWQEGSEGHYRITDWLMTTPLGNLILAAWYASVAGVYAIGKDVFTFGIRDGLVAVISVGTLFNFYEALRYLFGKPVIANIESTLTEGESDDVE